MTTGIPNLMAQAAQSTANIGWLQEYMSLWNLLEKIADRILVEQGLQTKVDEEARELLQNIIFMADTKLGVMQKSYERAYARHLMLMDRVLNDEESA